MGHQSLGLWDLSGEHQASPARSSRAEIARRRVTCGTAVAKPQHSCCGGFGKVLHSLQLNGEFFLKGGAPLWPTEILLLHYVPKGVLLNTSPLRCSEEEMGSQVFKMPGGHPWTPSVLLGILVCITLRPSQSHEGETSFPDCKWCSVHAGPGMCWALLHVAVVLLAPHVVKTVSIL